MTACYYHVTHNFQIEFTLYSFSYISRNSLLEASTISQVTATRFEPTPTYDQTGHLAEWLSACLPTKWLWIRISLLALINYYYAKKFYEIL